MAYNAVALKKTMLTWEAIAKHAPADLAGAAKKMAGEHPEVAKAVKAWTGTINALNQKLGDLLDRIVIAKEDKKRSDAAKSAIGNIRQFENFVKSTQLPPEVQKKLKTGLADLAKGLQNSV